MFLGTFPLAFGVAKFDKNERGGIIPDFGGQTWRATYMRSFTVLLWIAQVAQKNGCLKFIGQLLLTT